MVAALLAASPVAVRGAIAEIDSTGPLTRVIVGDQLNCQVAHQADVSLEVFGDQTGACGTFLAIGGTLFGPDEIPSGSFTRTPWSPVSQAAVSGAGTRGDPFRLVTVVDATVSLNRTAEKKTRIGDEILIALAVSNDPDEHVDAERGTDDQGTSSGRNS